MQELKLVTVSFDKSSESYGPALEMVLNNVVKLHRPHSVFMKFHSTNEANEAQSKIKEIKVDGEALSSKLYFAETDNLSRVVSILTKDENKIDKVVKEFGAVKHMVMFTKPKFLLVRLYFKSEEAAEAADNKEISLGTFTLNLRPYKLRKGEKRSNPDDLTEAAPAAKKAKKESKKAAVVVQEEEDDDDEDEEDEEEAEAEDEDDDEEAEDEDDDDDEVYKNLFLRMPSKMA